MKLFKTLAAILALYTSAALAQHQHHPDKPSTHGMLVFGTHKIYLNHLPMFHSPHDYQVLLEAELDQASLATYLATTKSSDETVYTLVPEVFVLPEMIEHPRPFKAQIFKGHFERGGELIAANVTVKISKVLHFKKFEKNAVHPPQISYLLIGNAQEQFLAHVITAKPDFDQILKVNVNPAMVDVNTAVKLTFPGLMNTEPLTDGAQISSGDGVDVKVEKKIYTEFDDLSM